ncbi:LCR [Medicago truncatula]|uniref:LCR n=1 Tax=Medicago truncatula TaxID=3880 RepID=A0A072UPS4_MEDTR|nr:LCR [Medicago truncatula]
MTHTQKFFMAALMVVLLFSIGMHKTECRNVVHVKCIGSCPFAEPCDTACKRQGFVKGECTPQNFGVECCCANFKD